MDIWYWVTDIHAASNNHYPNSKWTQWPAIGARLPVDLGNFCLTRGQLTEFSALADVFLQQRISKRSLQPVGSHWVSSKGTAVVGKWLLQLQGSTDAFCKRSPSAQRQMSWDVGPLTESGAFSSLLSGSASSNLAPFCLPTGALPWGLNSHFTAQLPEAGIIN